MLKIIGCREMRQETNGLSHRSDHGLNTSTNRCELTTVMVACKLADAGIELRHRLGRIGLRRRWIGQPDRLKLGVFRDLRKLSECCCDHVELRLGLGCFLPVFRIFGDLISKWLLSTCVGER